MKFFSKKTFLFVSGILAIILISSLVGALIYVSSPGFKEKARQYALHEIEMETGGKVTLGRMSWNLWTRRITFLDLTIRGTEPTDGPPLVHVESIESGVNLRSLLERKVDLFELTVTRPEFHLSIDSRGNTNLPSPPLRNATNLTQFQLSIDNFKIAQGSGFVNDRQIDLDFVVKNLNSDLSFHSVSRILTAHLSYDGVIEHAGQRSIPYSLSSDFDFTRGTLLAKHLVVSTGKTQLQLQGRIDDVLTSNITGKLSYSGNADTSFLNYFFPEETLAGVAKVAGALEFSKAAFSTHGTVKTDSIGFERWNAASVSGNYDYRFPEKRLTLDRLSAGVFGGTAEGKISVDSLPGPSRITLNLAYKDLDGVAMAREFPWDPKYRIESRISGNLQGWFEGRIERFEFNGDASLASAMQGPEAGILSLPVDGSLGYSIRPGQANVTNGNFHLLSTSIQAEGPIDKDNVNLKVHLASSDLSDLRFLYADANGAGSFDGVLNGPIKTPLAAGSFDLQHYKYREWTIEKASGMARLDTLTNIAKLDNVVVLQGQSQIVLQGTSTLDGAKVDLRLHSDKVRAEDVTSIVKQQFGGVLSGTIHLTSLNPLRFDGDVHGSALELKGQTLQEANSDVQYDAPTLKLQKINARDNGSTLTGGATYNTTTEAMTFDVNINSVDLKRLQSLGMPDAVEGKVQQAHLTGSGTPAHPAVDGDVQLLNVAFQGETFPTAHVHVTTKGSEVTLTVSETHNLALTAHIDREAKGYPFNANATFSRYSIERLAGFTKGTLTVTGAADLKGSLSDIAHISGSGHIDPVEIGIQDQSLHSSKPFAFEFNSEQLKLTDAEGVSLVSSIGGQQYLMKLTGSVGLTSKAILDLKLSGQLDSGLLISDKAWTINGVVDVNGTIRGTVAKPELQGRASFTDLSIARQGVTTSLTALKGDVIFDERLMRINNVTGRSGGGTIQIQGTGMIEGATLGALNFRIAATSMRVRYPTGASNPALRSVVDGMLSVGGTFAAPTVSGNIQIQSLTLNSSFDELLALFDTGPAVESSSPFGNLQLSLQVEGNRNISVRNELASAEARIDLGIKGTVDKPALTGHIETNNGVLLFQGKKYDVTRGNIDFVNPVRIDPAINIQAQTTVRNYQIFLTISGRMSHPLLNMRSEPPQSALEIVNLMSGSKTTDEIALSTKASAAPTGEQVFQGGAASILSDMLVSRVGSKFNLMGLDRNVPSVRIDPIVVGAQNSTTARITVSQNFTKDLSVTYSQDLTSNKQQIIQIEYFITKNISILASKDENDVKALDLRVRRRF